MSGNDVSGSRARCVRAAGVLVLALLAPACGLVREQAQVDPAVQSVPRFFGHGQPDPILPDCSINTWVRRASESSTGDTICPRRPTPGEREGAKSSTKGERTTTEDAKFVKLPPLPNDPVERRTQAQAELMTYADQLCNAHVAGIYAKNATFNLSFGLLTSLFSGGAAVASGRAATNLAAESALFSSSRSLVNTEVYYGYIGPAVMTEIHAMRADLHEQIAAKRSCTINEYPAQEAIGDALVYHEACSFSTGLASLLNKAGTTRVGEDKLRSAQVNAMTVQLKEAKATLDTLKTARVAIPDADKDTQKAKQLDKDIDSAQQEIRSLEGLQRFVGIVDPDALAPAKAAPASREQQISDQKASIVVLQAAVAKAANGTADEKKKAADDLDNAQKVLAQLREPAVNANLLALEVKRIEDDLAADRKQTRKLRSAGKSAEADALDQKIKTEEAELAGTQADLQDARLLVAQTRSIDFGIHACAPLKVPTLH